MTASRDNSAAEGSGHSTPSVALAVPAHPAQVSDIRRMVSRVGRSAGLDEDRLADVALAVGEACANAIVHAYSGDEGVLRVTADIVADGLQVVVADDGRGMAPRADSPGLGLGVPLMVALTTTLEFRSGPRGGTETWMVFATEGEGARSVWARTG